MTREEAIVAGMEVCEIQGRKGASTGRKGARNLRAPNRRYFGEDLFDRLVMISASYRTDFKHRTYRKTA